MSVGFPKGGFVVGAVKDKLKSMRKERGLDIENKVLERLAEIFEVYTFDEDLDDLQNDGTQAAKSLEIFNRVKADLEKLI